MPDNYRENQKIALEYAQRIDRPRRDAVDYGVPPAPHMPRHAHAAHISVPAAWVAPAVPRLRLPDLSPDAPSKSRNHPYAMLFLDNLGSGACHPPPPPSHCPECKADAFLESARQKVPNALTIVPDTAFKGPKVGAPVYVDFREPGNSYSGVLLVDILSFTAEMVQPHYLLVRQPAGAIKVTLRIEGYEEVDDIIYANCAHRMITRFNLAWWLALAFRRLAQDKFRHTGNGLRLRGLYSADGIKWTAMACFGL
ncbi:hypothetical protein C8F04DRAFT_1229249 [Mycena alexandri]|uniref:Uncharacterized protein n=1 Tax=Mycena alexandri TaxID=1745969 RepID=A0AAD6XCX6_9AGAR|nr:hypothetical protein C8F04DRAFT_1229249 [Mycena alexandri]